MANTWTLTSNNVKDEEQFTTNPITTTLELTKDGVAKSTKSFNGKTVLVEEGGAWSFTIAKSSAEFQWNGTPSTFEIRQ